jgi:hypothetical protein
MESIPINENRYMYGWGLWNFHEWKWNFNGGDEWELDIWNKAKFVLKNWCFIGINLEIITWTNNSLETSLQFF